MPVSAFADDEVAPDSGSGHSHPELGFFSDDERDTLGQLCDSVLPGATRMGAVLYIETLLTAFEVDPPRIFAGGPFSDRHPYAPSPGSASGHPVNSFKNFVPLSRAQEAAWKLKIYGSSAFSEGWWNEKTLGRREGLRDLIKKGLADACAQSDGTLSFACTSKEFHETVRELVVESCFAAPEYGGNAGLQGWKLAYFPGDVQPQGYTDAEVSQPDPHDPDSLGIVSRIFVYLAGLFQKGKIFR